VRDLQGASDKNKNTVNLRLTGYNRKGVYCPSQILPQKWRFLVDAPFKISDHCCDVMKKQPAIEYATRTGSKPFIGVMAWESNMREREYLKNGGCNAFSYKRPVSMPLGFWTEQDVLAFLKYYDVPHASVYGKIEEDGAGNLYTTGERSTGCMFCMLGVHLEKEPNRFQRMRRTHPKQWSYCMYKLGVKQVLDYIGVASGEDAYYEQRTLDLSCGGV